MCIVILAVVILSVFILSVVILSVVILSVLILSVVILSVLFLSVVILSVVILSVVMLNVVAPPSSQPFLLLSYFNCVMALIICPNGQKSGITDIYLLPLIFGAPSFRPLYFLSVCFFTNLPLCLFFILQFHLLALCPLAILSIRHFVNLSFC